MTNVQKAYDRVYRSDEIIGNVLMKTLNVNWSGQGRNGNYLFLLTDLKNKTGTLEDGYWLSFRPNEIRKNGELFLA
jgi:hypothetical protein